ncbi:unnamed protein product [Clonostachys solani]|uniref:Uncharacterized protein n=1 Tax=Clonostachys solani TaxID=160281 RepID=A0A9P0EGK6_9HYPO|nr:unnamed protein product [Clonostachys solani]
MFKPIVSLAALTLGIFATTAAATPAKLIDPNLRYSNMTLEMPPQAFPVLHTSFRYPPDCGEKSYKGSGRLEGLKALITGGDSGIGRSIVIAYLREGAKVAINYLPEEEADAQALSDLMAEEGLSFERIPGDLGNEDFCTELVTEAHRRLGGLDILINHAGFSGNLQGPHWRPIEQLDGREMEQIYKINVFATLYLTRAAVPLLPAGGSIIVTSSNIAAHPVGPSVLYGSSKAAITHTIRSLAMQLAPRGIRVNGVAPRLTYTPFLAQSGFTNTELELASQVLEFHRLAQPAEVAMHYVELADPANTYMSGEVIAVAGAQQGL